VTFKGWPRVVGAVALVVLGACGAALVVIPSRPTSLISRSNWDLAKALPSDHDFPPDWNYALQGTVRRAAPKNDEASREPGVRPTSVYAPADCGNVPKILGLYKTANFAALVHVDRSKDDVASATVLSSDEPEPNARFIIWPVPDGPALIADYLDWIGRCHSYSLSAVDPDGQVTDTRTVVTTVDTRDGDDAVTVTRSTNDDQSPTASYHVVYYAVRGILLECATNWSGSDVDLVKRLAVETLNRLRGL
jgi:hypothetical protein